MKIKLFVKDEVVCKEIAKNLEKDLISEGFEVVEDDHDYAISIGGDGTFLKMIKKNKYDSSINYIGINVEGLGYLTSITPEEIPTFIKALKNNDLIKDETSYIKVRIKSLDNKDDIVFKALNEIAIRSSSLKATHLNLSIQGTYLEDAVGDGIVISTSLGSSAYNKSLGGPIVDKKLNALIITPIAPLNNNIYTTLNNSFVTLGENRIDIVPTEDSNDIIVSMDGQSYKLKDIESLEITLSNKKLNLYHLIGQDYIKKLNDKFIK